LLFDLGIWCMLLRRFLVFGIFMNISAKKFLLIGTFFAFAFATRLTAGLSVLFFVIDIITQKLALSKKN